MTDFDFDLFVIGAGSGGVRASRIAAALGARVAVCEERYLGGTCVNVGCVPKKLFVYGSHYGADLEDAAGYGWTTGEVHFDWRTLLENKDKEIARLNGVYERILTNVGVEIFDGRGRITGPHEVEVAGVRHSARHILVATGSWPFVPDEANLAHLVTSNELFRLESLPGHITVIGGGYIAVEFAGIFAGMGAKVTLVHRGDKVLRGFDEDVRTLLTESLRHSGIDLRLERLVVNSERSGDGLSITLSDGATFETDLALCAVGRRPLTAGLGLEALGVQLTDRGAIVVDEQYRSSVSSILAVGDVIDRIQLTPVALAEGMQVAKNLFGDGPPEQLDYDGIPSAVFSQPNVASVGLTETAARQRYGDVRVFRSEFTPMKHTISGRRERSLMKLVVDAETDKVVGCHMVGPDAGEIIQGLAVAMKCGATKAQFDGTIGIHPTAAEEFVTMRTPVSP